MKLALIDGDLLCYRVSAIFDEQIDFGEGGSFRYLDKDAATKAANAEVNDLADAINADRVLVCLSDTKENFRKAIYGRYKSHRPSEKPPLVHTIREALAAEWPTIIVPRLEADDVMGLLSTDGKLAVPGHPRFFAGVKKRVIVSCDKDMRTIPGLLFNPNKPDLGVVSVSTAEADRMFYSQILTGDPVDNYPGCPRIGPKSKFVADIQTLDEPCLMWEVVVEAYLSKGLGPEDAVVQGRMARILRPGEYNPVARTIKLWTPPDDC